MPQGNTRPKEKGDHYWKVIELFRQGKSGGEIAAVLPISRARVYQILAAAQKNGEITTGGKP